MKRITFPVILGLLLFMCGGLLLLQATDIIKDYEHWFWAAVFASGGILFLINLIDRVWWASYPGFPLLGIAAAIVIAPTSPTWGWAAFLIISSISFWVIYLSDKENSWWAIMPGGALVSLGAVLMIESYVSGMVATGICSLGLSLTFLLIIALTKNNHWAYIPAGALAIVGVLTMALGSSAKAILYVCAAILMLVGIFLIIKTIIKK